MAQLNQRSEPAAGSLLSASDGPLRDLPLSGQMAFLVSALGQCPAGTLYLLSGNPGSGKSLLSLQMALDLARSGRRSLLLLTEQPAAAVKARARMMVSDRSVRAAKESLQRVCCDENVRDVAALPDYVLRHVLNPTGAYHGVDLVVLDSIQGQGLSSAATKAYGRVSEASRLLTAAGVTVLLISHVTKRGNIAGPKALEHEVDVALMLRRAMQGVMLSVVKNRFGPPAVRPVPLVIDDATTRLRPAPLGEPRPGSARTFHGTKGLTEVQASVAMPACGRVGRTIATGVPSKEVAQLLGCLATLEGLSLGDLDLDYTIQTRLPRADRYQPHLGLPLVMALIGSYLQREVPTSHLYLGEIDLFGRVLAAPEGVMEILAESLLAQEGEGLTLPVTLVAARSSVRGVPLNGEVVHLVPCESLREAVVATWPDLG